MLSGRAGAEEQCGPPGGSRPLQRCTNLTLARDRKSHTDAEVVPSDERGHGVSLAGGPGTAIAIRRKLDQPLSSRGAVGGPPRKAVWQCKRAVQERKKREQSTQLDDRLWRMAELSARTRAYMEPNAPGGNEGEGPAPGAPPGECDTELPSCAVLPPSGAVIK